MTSRRGPAASRGVRSVGTFRVSVEVAPIGDRGRRVAVRSVLADTGSELTWLPAAILRGIGVSVEKPGVAFVTADGREIRRDVGYVFLRCGPFETIDEVVLGEEGDLPLLGARTLEGFGALVDPARKRLVSAGPYPAAACF